MFLPRIWAADRIYPIGEPPDARVGRKVLMLVIQPAHIAQIDRLRLSEGPPRRIFAVHFWNRKLLEWQP
jgi:hypothetical protein